MTASHDDLPHPIPGYAYLRYKENWFFILLAPDSQAFGVVHFNHEPGHDRARYTVNLEIAGRSIRYANATPFPPDYAFARTIGDGALTLEFTQPQQRFDLSLACPEIDLRVAFTARQPVFDFAACRTAGNPAPSFQEVMTLGLNLPYNHQQQGLDATGEALFPDGTRVAIHGTGYRDHSWVMRADAAVMSHNWCGFNFPGTTFGIKTLSTVRQPGVIAKEGYVADADGTRALSRIEVISEGEQADGLCRTLIHDVTDVYGREYRIVSDVAGRHAHVPLASEAPSGAGQSHIVENFCPAILDGDQPGFGLVEIGRNSLLGGPWS